MTNEELERVTRSITGWQEVAAKNIAEITKTQAEHTKAHAEHAETQAEHDKRIKRFERSYSKIANLLQRHDRQLVAVTDNSNKLNDIVANLALSLAETNVKIAEAHARIAEANVKIAEADARIAESNIRIAETNLGIAETNASVDRLSATVDRYITARSNNGSNGAGDD